MAKWDNLPNEILRQILTEVKYYGNTRWKFVNKQWYNIFQWKRHKSIVVRMLAFDNRLNHILNSPFNPGFWVRNMKMSNIDTYDAICDSETIQKVMTRCPNVKVFSLITNNSRTWSCFSSILLTNDYWKELQELEPPYNIYHDHLSFLHYFNCALYLKNTIQSLTLGKEIINTENCKYLQGFRALKTLTIDKKILNSVNSCRMIFQNLPCFPINLKVNFFTDTSFSNKATLDSRMFSNVKELTVTSFRPSHDQDFLQLIKEFHGIQKLIMINDSHQAIICWPLAKQISKPVVKSFFEFIHQIPSVRLSISVDSVTWFLNEYYNYCDSIVNQGKVNATKISFRQTQKESGRLNIIIENKKTTLYVQFQNTITNKRNLWNQVNYTVQDIYINNLDYFCSGNMAKCLHGVLSSFKGLGNLTINKGKIQDYVSAPEYEESIESLVFNHVHFYDQVFPTISTDFPYLKNLDFNFCHFKNARDNEKHNSIFLPNTMIDILRFNYSGIDFYDLLISVVSTDSNISRYFLKDKATNILCEITRQSFISFTGSQDNFGSSMNSERIEVFYIVAKSIKQLVLLASRAIDNKIDNLFCDMNSVLA